MASSAKILLFLTISLFFTNSLQQEFIKTSNESNGDESVSAHKLVEHYGFPAGILPENIVGFNLEPNGDFSIEFSEDCKFDLESGYSLDFKKKITGSIDNNKIKNLKGVSVKVLFFWLQIDTVIRDGDNLSFYVGVLSAKFGLENFVEIPQCGCGFDCNSSNYVSSV